MNELAETLEDVFEKINSSPPGISELNLDSITKLLDNGWYEQVIWKILIRVNSKGEIIK